MGRNIRYNYIDWMKAIGIFLIVYGHYFSYGDTYIYVFNVPLFFIISGFLYKKETTAKIFWKKLLCNLIIPMLLLIIVVQLYLLSRKIFNSPITLNEIKDILINIIRGQHKQYGPCWFIYTLALIKILRFYIPEKKNRIINLTIIPIFLIISYYLSYKGLYLGNAYVNVLLAYPVFAIGEYLQKYKDIINSLSSKGWIISIIIISFLIIMLCGTYNGYVWMYKNDYGHSIPLFFLGGCAGTALIFCICKLLDRYKSCIVEDISMGSLIIIGLHLQLVGYTKIMPSLDIISAIILTLIFVPVIRFAKKYCPFIIGIYRINDVK